MMHEHDLDLVAAYADGSASPSEADQVAQWLETCADCTEEFESQQRALEALATVGPATLSDLERAKLHRTVRESIAQIDLDAHELPAATESTERPKRAMGWLAGVAAAAVAVVLAGGVLSTLGGSNDSADLATTEPSLAEAATLEADTADEAAGATEMLTDDAMDDAMDEDMAASFESAAGLPPVKDLGDISADTLQALAEPPTLDQTDTTRAAPLPTEDRPLTTDDAESGPIMACLDAGLMLLDSSPTYLAVAALDGADIEIFQSEERLIVLVSNDCTVSVEFSRTE